MLDIENDQHVYGVMAQSEVCKWIRDDWWGTGLVTGPKVHLTEAGLVMYM